MTPISLQGEKDDHFKQVCLTQEADPYSFWETNSQINMFVHTSII